MEPLLCCAAWHRSAFLCYLLQDLSPNCLDMTQSGGKVCTWLLLTSGSFISLFILSWVWHSNERAWNRKRRLGWTTYSSPPHPPCAPYSERIRNDEWCSGLMIFIVGRQVLKQAHWVLTAERWRQTSARRLQYPRKASTSIKRVMVK